MSSAFEAVNSAIDAAAQRGGKKGFEEMLVALAGDAEQLDQRFEPVTIANQQLWPMPRPRVPEWVNDGWEALKARLLPANENWKVWITWYEDRMFGNTTDTALEVARAAEVPDSAWREGPKSANAFIQQQLRGAYLKYGSENPPDPQDTVAFQQWLSAKPREWTTVIAARAALRMLASLGASPGDTTLLAIVRAISASRYAVLHPHGTKVASDAAEFLRDRQTQVAIAAFYAASAVGADDEPSRAVTIISDLGLRLDHPAWIAAILRDAFALVHGTPPQALARAPLWRPENEGGTPPVVQQAWRNLAQVLRETGRHWEAWTDWYDYVLEGSPPAAQRDDAWEAAFIGIPEPLPWDAGARAVNTEIVARLRTHTSNESAKYITNVTGVDLEPVPGVESPIRIIQRPDGRIGADPGSQPYLTPPLTAEDHVRSLAACRARAERLQVTASARGFQGRSDYADGIAAYLEWLPEALGTGNILLADGEARLLSKLFTADEGTLPTGFAAQLAVLLEDHIGLRVFYPEVERHYFAVRTGRLVTPLERDAVEGLQRAIDANTPIVFHESVKAVVDETAKPVPEVKPPRPEDAPVFDPNYPRPPKDPIADIDPAKTRSFLFASAANRIWEILLRGKDLPAAIEGWHKACEQIRPFIGPILSFLKSFSGGDGGTPPMPPTIMTWR